MSSVHDDPAPPRRAPRLHRWQAKAAVWRERLRPWRWLWPPLAFAAGVGSFFLVERQQSLGALLALGLLATWVLLLGEGVLTRLRERLGRPPLPRGIATFLTQMVHQETLFFCLPFLLATTVWQSGQALFTLLMLAMALLSLLDPLYYRLAQRQRGLYFAFHAQCVFLVVLVTLPLMLHLTTGESLKLAILAMLLVSLPSLLHLLRGLTSRHWLALLLVLPLLAGTAWLGRVWVPPATLWLTASALSPGFEESQREPRGRLRLTPDALASTGLFAYTAIRAPRGLEEKVFHVWRHDGKTLDRIPLEIVGGRAEGYRAWSHKRNFPATPSGDWQVDVMTDSGQRIGTLRFTVDDDPAEASLADGRSAPPIGVPGLNIGGLLPRRGGTDTPSEDEDLLP